MSVITSAQNNGGVPFPIKNQGSNSVSFATEFGQWTTIDINNPQIKARSRIKAYHNPSQWFWEIEFKNTGNRKVFFAWLLAGTPQALNQKYPNMSFGSAGRYAVLDPNEIRKDEITNKEYDNINHSMYVKIHSICYDFKPGTEEYTCKLEENNTSQNSTGSTGTSSMNRDGYIGNNSISSNKIDSEKNQSYQQFKQNGESLLKERKFSEAKEEFQKSLQYSVNDSQIAYSNKMIAFCDEYSKKNEKYDNISKGIDLTKDIINSLSKKDNVFGKKTIDDSSILFKNSQSFQEIINSVNGNDDVVIIKNKFLNYFFELGFDIKNTYQTKDNLSFGYGFKNNIGIEIKKNPNKIIIQFPSDKNNLGKLILKELNNNKIIGKSILTNKYNIEYTPETQIDLTNFSIDNQNISDKNLLIEEIDLQKYSSQDMILRIKNYFEKLNYKYISTNYYGEELSILKFEDFYVSINSKFNYVSAISIDIPNEKKYILNELKSKMIISKFSERNIHQHSIALYYNATIKQNISKNESNQLSVDNEVYKTGVLELKSDFLTLKNNKEGFIEKLFTFFKNQKLIIVKTERDNERGSTNYFLTQNKTIELIDYNNKLMLVFKNENENFGKRLLNDLKPLGVSGFEKENDNTCFIFFDFN